MQVDQRALQAKACEGAWQSGAPLQVPYECSSWAAGSPGHAGALRQSSAPWRPHAQSGVQPYTLTAFSPGHAGAPGRSSVPWRPLDAARATATRVCGRPCRREQGGLHGGLYRAVRRRRPLAGPQAWRLVWCDGGAAGSAGRQRRSRRARLLLPRARHLPTAEMCATNKKAVLGSSFGILLCPKGAVVQLQPRGFRGSMPAIRVGMGHVT